MVNRISGESIPSAMLCGKVVSPHSSSRNWISGSGVIVAVGVSLGIGVTDGVSVSVGVSLGVRVGASVAVAVDVGVSEGSRVAVRVAVAVGVLVAVGGAEKASHAVNTTSKMINAKRKGLIIVISSLG